MKNYFDSINRIYNSYNSGKKISLCKYSKFTVLIFVIFLEKQYIENFFILLIKNKKYIIVLIKDIKYLKFISKPSRKIFIKNKYIKNNFLNIGLCIINTNMGILTIQECKKIGIGGFIILIIL